MTAWLPWLGWVIGGVLVVGGLLLGAVQARHRRGWQRVDGTVGGHGHSLAAGGDGSSTSRPIVAYTTLDGQEHRETQQWGVGIGIYTTGQRVPVWYDPARPSRFTANVRGSHAVWLVLCLIGAGVLVAWNLIL